MQPAWATDIYATLEQRARHIDTVYGLLAETMKERTTQEWLALFRELDIPAAPLSTPDALFDNPHLNAVGLFETVDTPHGPVRFPGVPTWFSRPRPCRGSGSAVGRTPMTCSASSGLPTWKQRDRDRPWTSRWGRRRHAAR